MIDQSIKEVSAKGNKKAYDITCHGCDKTHATWDEILNDKSINEKNSIDKNTKKLFDRFKIG